MNICIITLNIINQGTYWRAYHFGRVLAQRGHNISLVCTSIYNRNGLKISKRDGISIIESPDFFYGSLRSGWDPSNILSRIRWLSDQKFDLVHAFESRPTVIFPSLYLKDRGIPMFMDWSDWFGRGGSVEQRSNPMIRAILRPIETFFEEHYRVNASGSTVICSTLFNKAISLNIASEKITLLRNGVNLDVFRHHNNPTFRTRLAINNNDFVIGYLGSSFKQDAKLMFDAFQLIQKTTKNVRLLLLNFRSPGMIIPIKYKDDILSFVEYDESKMAQILSICNAFWLPLCDCGANQGRFPIKLGIYLALGKPIIATRVGDAADILTKWQAGKVCNDNPNDLAETTINMIAQKDSIVEMGQNARRCAEDIFNWYKNTIQLENFYYEMSPNLDKRPNYPDFLE